MIVARAAAELDPAQRAVAIGTFDGVHRGHRAVIEAALASGMRTCVITFDPHPRTILGNRVELLATLERRLELIAELGVQETLVLEFTVEFARVTAEEFAGTILRPLGATAVVAGPDFSFGNRKQGDLALLGELGFDARTIERLDGVSSSTIRTLLQAGDVAGAARLLGRPPEVEGTVVLGDQRGGTLGFPTANLAVPADLLVPRYGIYAGSALGTRTATSIGTNPHYGGLERRVEAYLLDYDGDLYGKRLVVELWERLRDEQSFGSEAELVAAIALDVERTRAAARPG